jgi:hypothetical protein
MNKNTRTALVTGANSGLGFEANYPDAYALFEAWMSSQQTDGNDALTEPESAR